MPGLKGLLGEIHRRYLWQVVGIYLGASWVVLQVIETLTETAGLPEWIGPFAIVLLLIGFPIMLTTAFLQEGMSKRREAAEPAAEVPSAAPPPDPADPPKAPSPHAAEGAVLTTAAPATPSEAPSQPTSGLRVHRIFTWRNALLGGAAAFMLLGIVTAAWIVMRTAGVGPAATLVAQGVLDERDAIILADFEGMAGDSVLAQIVTETVRVDLSQAGAVRLADPAFVNEALQRMEREDGALDMEAAREIARREGIKAVMGGDIGAVGSGYLLTAWLVAPESGEILVSERETAADSSQIISAIDKLSRRLRERIGEPLRSIQKKPGLEGVTTGSFEALKKYTQAVRASDTGRPQRAIALLEESVELDPEFAMAWRKLGATLTGAGEQEARAVEAYQKAYEQRDRLTERERYLTVGIYFTIVTEDAQAAINAYESLLEADPEDSWALNNLGLIHGINRDYERAADHYQRSIEADSTNAAIPYSNITAALVAADRVSDAKARNVEWFGRYPDANRPVEQAAFLAHASGDRESAIRRFEELLERAVGSPYWTGVATEGLAALALAEGRFESAEGFLTDERETLRERGLTGDYVASVAWEALARAVVLGDAADAKRRLEAALAQYPLAEMSALDRPYDLLATSFAAARELDRASSLLAEVEAEVTLELRQGTRGHFAERARGAVALAEARYADAVEHYRRSDHGVCRLCPLPGLAAAYDGAGERDSAIAVYERWVTTPGLYRLAGDRVFLGVTYERLAQLYDEAEDWEKAAEYYAKLIELWSDADAELQPRVQSAQQRLDEIFAERG
jgi:tetratricopeptide (TPR) repeat protein